MGSGTSTLTSGGTLRGSFAPALRDDFDNHKLLGPKSYKLLCPKGKKGGDFVTALINGERVSVQIPQYAEAGSNFLYKYEGQVDKVIASTLPSIPGMEIVQAKPIVWGSVSHAYYRQGTTDSQQSMGEMVGTLIQQAQTILLQQALAAGCNAVLGVSYTITNDSSGNHGNSKMVMVTSYGTPCTVAKSADIPVIQAEHIVVPLNNY